MSSKTIVLIGPMSAGKSTIASELAKLTGMRRIPMDRVRWYYYLKNGFSLEEEESFSDFNEIMNYWKPFELEAVKSVLHDFPNSIIDFGAGHSHYVEEKRFNEAYKALKNYPNVVLLLPSEDVEKSLEICNQRLMKMANRELTEIEISANLEFIKSESNKKLAKYTVYTGDNSPQEIAEKILAILKI